MWMGLGGKDFGIRKSEDSGEMGVRKPATIWWNYRDSWKKDILILDDQVLQLPSGSTWKLFGEVYTY